MTVWGLHKYHVWSDHGVVPIDVANPTSIHCFKHSHHSIVSGVRLDLPGVISSLVELKIRSYSADIDDIVYTSLAIVHKLGIMLYCFSTSSEGPSCLLPSLTL